MLPRCTLDADAEVYPSDPDEGGRGDNTGFADGVLSYCRILGEVDPRTHPSSGQAGRVRYQ